LLSVNECLEFRTFDAIDPGIRRDLRTAQSGDIHPLPPWNLAVGTDWLFFILPLPVV
jgi:hypothetical protein